MTAIFETGKTYATSGFNPFNESDRKKTYIKVTRRTKSTLWFVIGQSVEQRRKIKISDQDYVGRPKGDEYIDYTSGPWGSAIEANPTEKAA